MTTLAALAGAMAGTPHLPGAACRGVTWLADLDDTTSDPDDLAAGRAICHTCPALADCQAWIASLPPDRLPGGMVAAELRQPGKPVVIDEDAWLARYFARRGGPVEAARVLADAKTAGVGQTRLRRAGRRLGIRSTRGERGRAIWQLPTDAEQVAS
jgi:hypothetical protein